MTTSREQVERERRDFTAEPAAAHHEFRVRAEQGQTLLVDADDTLWENNIYFERAIARFISFLNHKEHAPAQVREVLNQVEHENVLKHGYGINSFAHALVDTFELLSVDPVTPELHARIHSFAHEIAEHPVEVIESVVETLEYLRSRHHLILMTKGNFAEQTGKVERSGLKSFFAAVEIPSEKNAAAYEAIIEKYALNKEMTWMVGNSPKSDINPALQAGINAVFVPHADTWVLEHEEVRPDFGPGRLLRMANFGELKAWF